MAKVEAAVEERAIQRWLVTKEARSPDPGRARGDAVRRDQDARGRALDCEREVRALEAVELRQLRAGLRLEQRGQGRLPGTGLHGERTREPIGDALGAKGVRVHAIRHVACSESIAHVDELDAVHPPRSAAQGRR
ncbi:hypothetical protein [Saltatorellus ferox]|uniref:hypothetical protein n=1 Tax=Saltatorellus ferox TaxID=2528018 RepID=UPI003AF365E2